MISQLCHHQGCDLLFCVVLVHTRCSDAHVNTLWMWYNVTQCNNIIMPGMTYITCTPHVCRTFHNFRYVFAFGLIYYYMLSAIHESTICNKWNNILTMFYSSRSYDTGQVNFMACQHNGIAFSILIKSNQNHTILEEIQTT